MNIVYSQCSAVAHIDGWILMQGSIVMSRESVAILLEKKHQQTLTLMALL